MTLTQPSTSTNPSFFVLPDLDAMFNFRVGRNAHAAQVSEESHQWMEHYSKDVMVKRRKTQGIGELNAFCFPSCRSEMLRVICDFVNFIFHIDDLVDGMEKKEADEMADQLLAAMQDFCSEETGVKGMAEDFWRRFSVDAPLDLQRRLKDHLQVFFDALTVEVQYRLSGVVPDPESYVTLRRETSCFRTGFDMEEYCHGLDLPDKVMSHPSIITLQDCANDALCLSNDILSFKKEIERGDAHNMVTILMKLYGLELQSAMDKTGDMCADRLKLFGETKKSLPSFGNPELDARVQRYIEGVEDFTMGFYHWSYVTDRYFGGEGAAVRKDRIVRLEVPTLP